MATIPALPQQSDPTYWAVVSKRYRLRHPDRVRKRWKDQSARLTKIQMSLVEARKGEGCVDCKQHFDFWILQFDHVPERGPKLFKINPYEMKGLNKFLAELAKCDVVCANCHANRTYLRKKVN